MIILMFTCCTDDSSVINSIYSGQLQFSQKNYLMANESKGATTLAIMTLSI
jgi:hypothetical protein